MTPTRRTTTPVLAAGVVTVLTSGIVALVLRNGTSWSTLVDSYQVNSMVWSLAMGGIGVLVLRETPVNRLGPIFVSLSVLGLSQVLADELARTMTGDGEVRQWVAWWAQLFVPLVLGFLLLPLLYPDGVVFSSRWRMPARIGLVAAGVASLAYAVNPGVSEEFAPAVSSPLNLGIPEGLSVGLMVAGSLTVLAVGIGSLVSQVTGMRRAELPQRRRVAWLLAGFLLFVASFAAGVPLASLSIQLAALACLGTGIVRYQLFDIETVLSRSLVYLFVLIVSMVAALVAAWLMGSRSGVGVGPALVAAVTALVLAAAFGRLKAGVDRLLFGRRPDPMQSLYVLGERLGGALDPEAALPTTVTTLREALRLPYAAIVLEGEHGPAAVDGVPAGGTVQFPLEYAGRTVGQLALGLRKGERDLPPADRRLVATFARQAAVAAHAAQTTRDLRRSRERLVAAREEERRTVRRDLHDGVGPALAGIALGLESARVAADCGEADPVLMAELHEQSLHCLEEVRELARDLRPAALDELGLLTALRQHADAVTRLSGGRPVVEFEGPALLPVLSAAVEVAAYRIVQEALSNVSRHAAAGNCRVLLHTDGDLVVEVSDDGRGTRPQRAGVGLDSMRERAEELGGSCTVTFRAGLGTTVRAVLPVGVPA